MRIVHLLDIKATFVEESLACVSRPWDVIVSDTSAYWVGSVPLANAEALKAFLELAKKSQLAEMAEFSAIERGVAYGMLVRRQLPEMGFRLFVVTQPYDPWEKPECLFSGVVTEIEVIPKESRRVAIPSSVRKTRLLDVLKYVLWK